jgi:hypothetical protein
MKQPLTTRFNKQEIEVRARSLAHGTDLTMSDINRAALNIGLNEIEELKKDYPDRFDFEGIILSKQGVK